MLDEEEEKILHEIEEIEDAVMLTAIFKIVAPKVFPVGSWTNKEIRMLKKMGLLKFFGLEEEEELEEEDFFEGFFETKDEKDMWL